MEGPWSKKKYKTFLYNLFVILYINIVHINQSISHHQLKKDFFL